MWQKLYLGAVVLFFLAMNALLLRSVLGDKDLGTAVPVESVQRRLLESADDSNLNILRAGEKIGFCRWAASLKATDPRASAGGSPVPEGMIAGIEGYHLDFDGNLTGGGFDKVRFNFTLNLDTNRVWTRVFLRVRTPSMQWEIGSSAGDEALRLSIIQGEDSRVREFHFADLENPAALLASLGGASWAQALSGLRLPGATGDRRRASLGLEWQARTARRKIGHTQVPVYRLEAPLFDHYRIVVTLLESGEILRVDLPEDWALVNEDLLNM